MRIEVGSLRRSCFFGCLLALEVIASPAGAQTTAPGEWTWMGGSNTVLSSGNGQAAVYGTLGVPAAGNTPSGRANAVSWTDKNGNFWLFGGRTQGTFGVTGLLNDLWEFNPTIGEWAWIAGSNSGSSQPGAYGLKSGSFPGSRYGSSSWTDSTGNLWLFGGFGLDSAGITGQLNDLWIFDPAAGQWGFAGGNMAADKPG
jgi:hypothetical protein